MKTYFICADVHGFYNELMTALNDAGFDLNNKDHVFVSCGDLLDRGTQPLQCLQFVNNIPNDQKILIRGNHEDLMETAIIRKGFLLHDIHNGTFDTALAISSSMGETSYDDTAVLLNVASSQDYNKYIHSLYDYYDDGKNVFVHGWIPCFDKQGNTYYNLPNWEEGDWRKARWINGMEAWSHGIKLEGKTIFCGHWHTSWGHHFLHNDGMEFPNERSTNPDHRRARFDPFIDDGIVALDACTAFSGKINCIKVEVNE